MAFANGKVTAMECDIVTCVVFANKSSKVSGKPFILCTHHSQHFLPTFDLNYRNDWNFCLSVFRIILMKTTTRESSHQHQDLDQYILYTTVI